MSEFLSMQCSSIGNTAAALTTAISKAKLLQTEIFKNVLLNHVMCVPGLTITITLLMSGWLTEDDVWDQLFQEFIN